MQVIPLGDPPNLFFSGCGLGTQIKLYPDGMTVRGAGLHLCDVGGARYPMVGDLLRINRYLPCWSVETHGRPYDRVVRLALCVLAMSLPSIVQLRSTATESELVQTGAIIFAARLPSSAIAEAAARGGIS